MAPRLAALLIAILAAVLLSACRGSDGPGLADSSIAIALKSPTPTTTPTPMPTPTPSPTPTPIPTPAAPTTLGTDLGFAHQGGLILVRLLNPPQGDLSASLAGGSYPMLREGEVAFAVIGLDIYFAPGDYTLEVFANGQTIGGTTVSVAASEFPTEYITLPPESANLLTDTAAIEEENRTLAAIYAGFTPQRLWAGPWGLPAQGDITQPFGLLRSINGGPLFPHSGTDIAAEAGVPVVASAGGRVAFAGPLYLRGNSVIIDHGAGVFSGYHHLSELTVSSGQPVAQGDLIGRVGSTGLVSGPHLHWEVIVHGTRVDPVLFTFRDFGP